jgi:arylsulfatase A-like enzyme
MRLKLVLLFFVCVFLSLRLYAQSGVRGQKKLDVVFILVDDLGWKDVGCYGGTFYNTPHVDALAKEGMKFVRAYAAAPDCSPTRASLLTGQYPVRTGVTDVINVTGAREPEH